jgi:hypothetical protein
LTFVVDSTSCVNAPGGVVVTTAVSMPTKITSPTARPPGKVTVIPPLVEAVPEL